MATAQNYLFEITDKRVIAGTETEYEAWKAGLTGSDALLAAIKYNWRVELWGEGYGLQTFRRYGEAVALGDNHLRSDKNPNPTTARLFTFELPTSELYYNPYLHASIYGDTQTLRKK